MVDLTIFRQPYPGPVQGVLPSTFVAERELKRVTVELEDLVDPDIEAAVMADGGLDMLARKNPHLLRRAERYGSYTRDYGEASVRWVATGVTASDRPLETWRTIKLDELWPSELWDEFLRSW